MVVVKLMPALALRKLGANRLVRLFSLCIFILVIFAPIRAGAEISSELEVKSDDRFRGRSLSAGNPVVNVDVSIDTVSGIYSGGSATFILASQNRTGFKGVDAHIGFATHIDENVTVDIGVAGYIFTERYSGNTNDQYAEAYIGLSVDRFAVYVHYTPNYFDKNIPVLYADVNYSRSIGSEFSVKAHAGFLVQTSGRARLGNKSTRYDTRLAVSRPIWGLDAEIAFTYGGKDDRYFSGPWGGNSAFVFSVAKHF